MKKVKKRYLYPVLTTLLGALVTCGIVSILYTSAHEKAKMRFERNVAVHRQLIENNLKNTQSSLTALKSLFVSNREITREQFNLFTAGFLNQYSYIKSFSYHEFSTNLAGQHLLTKYVEPFKENEKIIGINKNLEYQKAIELSENTGKIVVTDIVKANNEGEVIFWMPVYKNNNGVNQFGNNIAGFGSLTLNLHQLVQQSLTNAGLNNDYEMQIYDVTDSKKSILIYGTSNKNTVYNKTIQVGNKFWLISISSINGQVVTDYTLMLITLFGGFFISGLMGLFVLNKQKMSYQRRQEIEAKLRANEQQALVEQLHVDSERLSNIIATQAEMVRADFDLENFMQLTGERLLKLTKAESVFIEVLDDKHSKVICAVGSLSHHIGLKIALDGSLSGKCIATKNVEVCAETQKNEHNNKELSLKMGLASLAVAPLIHADESIGVLKLMSSQINAFANHDLQTLKILAHVVGNALQQRINTDLKNNLISEMKDVTDALFKEKELAQVTLSAIGDAVITTDTEGQITYLNPVAEHLTGWLNEEAIGKNIQAICNLVHETTKTMVLNPVFCCLITKTVVEMEPYTLLINRQGIEYAIDDSAAPILDREGKAIGAVLIFRDVTQEREMTREISYQASHDSLTGLFNRSEFNKCVANSLEKHQITKRNSSLLYMDLDQFKIVNDTCGHGAGDQLLLEITQVFEKVLRSGDIIARLGGDEFGVLLEGCPPDISYNIADTLLKKVENYRFHWDTQVFTIGVSIGLVNFSVDNFDLTLALSAADAACYVAKERGRNQICVYEPTAAEQELRSSQMGWIGRIQKALEDNRLVLFAQPIVPVMKSDKCSLHYEMLLRMLGEDGKLIPPMAFIPSAERYNLMTMIDRWVVKTALQFAKKHSQAMCSINLSGQSLGDEKFLNFVKAELVSSDVNCANICFEVTETTAIASFGRAVYFMQELKVMGCRFSLDDFGSGMSSFNYLKQLPVDYLKIDGGFVKNMANDPIDHAMVESINNIGHIMGLHTIAEFVEDENILNMLNALGVDYAQGYGIGKPVNANSIDVIQAPGIIIPLITED